MFYSQAFARTCWISALAEADPVSRETARRLGRDVMFENLSRTLGHRTYPTPASPLGEQAVDAILSIFHSKGKLPLLHNKCLLSPSRSWTPCSSVVSLVQVRETNLPGCFLRIGSTGRTDKHHRCATPLAVRFVQARKSRLTTLLIAVAYFRRRSLPADLAEPLAILVPRRKKFHHEARPKGQRTWAEPTTIVSRETSKQRPPESAPFLWFCSQPYMLCTFDIRPANWPQ
jgi:hypothetical protein